MFFSVNKLSAVLSALLVLLALVSTTRSQSNGTETAPEVASLGAENFKLIEIEDDSVTFCASPKTRTFSPITTSEICSALPDELLLPAANGTGATGLCSCESWNYSTGLSGESTLFWTVCNCDCGKELSITHMRRSCQNLMDGCIVNLDSENEDEYAGAYQIVRSEELRAYLALYKEGAFLHPGIGAGCRFRDVEEEKMRVEEERVRVEEEKKDKEREEWKMWREAEWKVEEEKRRAEEERNRESKPLSDNKVLRFFERVDWSVERLESWVKRKIFGADKKGKCKGWVKDYNPHNCRTT